MKKEILIISDLWGKGRSDWFSNFEELLSTHYDVTFLDACELAAIDLANYNQESIHKQFVDFGIKDAVSKLLTIVDTPKICIGCSIGGVIVWKAALQGLPIESLTAISSTRLRYESIKPNCPIQLYFGENDKNTPNSSWFASIGCDIEILANQDHEMYKELDVVSRIIKEFV